MIREQTRISGFASRFCFVKLTLGRMPIFTRRSRASTYQLISARSSKNGTNGNFCLGHFSSSTHSDLVKRMAREVWRHHGLVFGTIVILNTGNCIGLLSNTGLFLSTGNRYLFLLQRHSSLSILDHRSCFNSPVSGLKISQSKFLIYTPLHHRLQFFDNWASIFSD